MVAKRPEVSRVYQNHTLDSTRWKSYMPRDDDIIISTSYKSGTTWMQMIMKHLIIQDGSWDTFEGFSPWLDSRFHPIEELIEQLESQTHRRCIKSHLALDGLPYFPQVKYIVVCRDPRDVFMSFWNHYSGFTDAWFQERADIPDQVGDPLPKPDGDIHHAWRLWITRGWFEWESEGYPFWGNMHHTKTFWAFRHLPNILLVHYNNLLNDCHHEIRRVADYAGIEVSEEHIAKVVEMTSFQTVRAQSEKIMGEMGLFKEGSKTFINKGTNGRWKSVLSADELQLYEETVARVLTPACQHWLETGELDVS